MRSAPSARWATHGSARRRNRPAPPGTSGRGRPRRRGGSFRTMRGRGGGHDLQVFGGQAIGELHRLVPAPHQDDRAMRGPAGGGDVRPGAGCAGRDRPPPRHRVGEARVVGDQDGLRRLVMLGLGQQVHRDMRGLVCRIGQHHHLGRAGDAVDADPAENLALGLRHIGVAGADDAVHRRDRRRAPGHRRHRLGAADAEHLTHPGAPRRRQHQRVQHAAGAGHAHAQPRATPATRAGMAFISTEEG